jgi:hypothetical protein
MVDLIGGATMIVVSEEFERHAAECRDMAQRAYDPAYRTALTRLANNLEWRAERLEHNAWLRSHAAFVGPGRGAIHTGSWLYF